MKWKSIWEKRNLIDIDTLNSSDIILEKLIKADGFDGGTGNIELNSWKEYINELNKVMNLQKSDSIFEVGCGGGAFLYSYYLNEHKVGGIDFSESLIKSAQLIMKEMDLKTGEAINLNCIEKYDIVVANSVFFYFPDYIYANEVLLKMVKKSKKSVVIMDIPNLELKEECENRRKAAYAPDEYEKKYEGLAHLYFDKDWFRNFGKENNLKLNLFDQNISDYGNSRFRFNCLIEK
jgi:ubiquinone/menaquinone biosynthesis C-methylase UbiE